MPAEEEVAVAAAGVCFTWRTTFFPARREQSMSAVARPERVDRELALGLREQTVSLERTARSFVTMGV